jgi:hypothetical protein
MDGLLQHFFPISLFLSFFDCIEVKMVISGRAIVARG